MAGDTDDAQKTEEPTQRRLEDAEKKGQIASSREVNNLFMLGAFTLMAAWLAPGMMRQGGMEMRRFIELPHQYAGDEGLFLLMREATWITFGLLALPLLIAVIAAFAGRLIQHRFLISADPLNFKLERISPIKGFKRIFSVRSVVEFVKGIVKIVVVGTVGYMVIRSYLSRLTQVPSYDISDLLALLSKLSVEMLVAMCCAVFVIALMDVAYQRFDYIKSLRMSKQEIKDEYKQQEGDPHIKQRLRQIRRERARKRMMAAVPSADVVITNPTHFAVALKYDAATMRAPVLIAKGADLVAQRIREVAKEHDIPLVENPPLARVLHATVDLDQEIPYEHYKAVAEVISYIYRLKGKPLRATT